MTKIRVLCYIPVHRNMEAMNALCLLELMKHEMSRGEVDLHICFLVGESLIQRARNTIANKFLRSDYDYLLMIDSDIIFKKEVLQQLLSRDKQLIGANYVHKNTMKRWAGKPDDFDEEVSSASFIPTGMILIKRNTFDLLKERIDVPTYKTSESLKEYGFFNCFIDNKILLSEDWAFSKRCEKAKIKGYIDNTIQLGHIGQKIYVGY